MKALILAGEIVSENLTLDISLKKFYPINRETFLFYFPIYNTMIRKETLAQIILDFQKEELPELIERELQVDLEILLKSSC